MEKLFYVYVYLNPLKPGNFVYGEYRFEFSPFYVGKGHNDRYLHHLKNAKRGIVDKNKHKYHTIKTILESDKEPIILKIFESNNEFDAFKMETNAITTIGKRINNSGPLTNLFDGGKGASLGYKWSEESKQKITGSGNQFFGKAHSEETVQNMIKRRTGVKFGTLEDRHGHEKAQEIRKKFSAAHQGHVPFNKGKSLEEICGAEKASEVRRRLSKSHQNKKLSETHKLNIGKVTKGGGNPAAKPIEVTYPNGEIRQFECVRYFQHTKPNLPTNMIYKLRQGKIDEYNGWKITNITKPKYENK